MLSQGQDQALNLGPSEDPPARLRVLVCMRYCLDTYRYCSVTYQCCQPPTCQPNEPVRPTDTVVCDQVAVERQNGGRPHCRTFKDVRTRGTFTP